MSLVGDTSLLGPPSADENDGGGAMCRKFGEGGNSTGRGGASVGRGGGASEGRGGASLRDSGRLDGGLSVSISFSIFRSSNIT
jgi:hypothetical protein